MIQSAGVVVVDYNFPEPKVLCVRAYSNWDFPKGRLEQGESHVQAAVRELEEETSLNVPADVVLVGISAPPTTYGKGSRAKTATYYLGDRVSQKQPFLPVNPELGKPENDEFVWVPHTQLRKMMPTRLSGVVEYVNNWIKLSPKN